MRTDQLIDLSVLTPFYRFAIGLDRLEKTISTGRKQAPNYPPHDLKVLNENEYQITVAVAGFTRDEIDISTEGKFLKVSGRKEPSDTPEKYLHQGIAMRSFELKWNLFEHVKVSSAKLKDGLLNINLTVEIPEELKPRKIDISE